MLSYLSGWCFEKETTFVENSDITVFREGKRAVILKIRRFLEFDLTKIADEPKEYDRV